MNAPEPVLNSPEFFYAATKLQLLDHLTGQGDRHPGNYFVKMERDGDITVTGIDNDQCFGATPLDPEGIRWTGRKGCPFRATRLPPVVDCGAAAAVEELAPDSLRGFLKRCELAELEILAALSRLEVVKRHIGRLRDNNRVINPGAWY